MTEIINMYFNELLLLACILPAYIIAKLGNILGSEIVKAFQKVKQIHYTRKLIKSGYFDKKE